MHFILSRLRNVCTRFARNENGNVIILVAGAMLVMVIAVGVAVDLAREQTLQSSMANAADAAALASGVAVGNAIQTGGACVSDLSDSTKLAACETTVAQDAANKFYKVNFPNQYQSTAFTPVVTLDEAAGTITLTAQTTEKTDFLKSVGVTSVPLNVYSKVKLASGTCGPSNGVPTDTMPTASSQIANYSLCAKGGTASSVTGNGKSENWTWTCNTNGTPTSCLAPLKGSCASVAATPTSPTGTICAVGTATSVTVDSKTGKWTWECKGTASSSTNDDVQCYADLQGQCNASLLTNGSSTAPTQSTLCTAGTPPTAGAKNSYVIESTPAGHDVNEGHWSWTCKGMGSSHDTVSCESPLDGKVGSADKVATTDKPENSVARPDILCEVGKAVTSTGAATNKASGNGIDQPWTWICAGSPAKGGLPAGRDAYGVAPLDGSCGSANGSDSYSSKPANTSSDSTVLCASGNAPSVSGSGTSKDPWSWTCDGSTQTTLTNYGTVAAGSPSGSCTATGVSNAVAPIDGVCGAAKGETFTSVADADAAGLCTSTSGQATTVDCPSSNRTNCWTCGAGNSTGKASGICGYKLECPTGTYGTPGNCTKCHSETINYYVRPLGGYFGFAFKSNNGGCGTDGGCPGLSINSSHTNYEYGDVDGTQFLFNQYDGTSSCYVKSTTDGAGTAQRTFTQACIGHATGKHGGAKGLLYLEYYGPSISLIKEHSNGTFTDEIVLKDYLTTTTGGADANAKNCGMQYSKLDSTGNGTFTYITLNPHVIVSPLKVNIRGGDATLNSDTPMKFSLSHADGSLDSYDTVGSLNHDEAWLMLDRKGNGIVHDGIVDGDDWFADHDGANADAYEDLALTFASSLQIDEQGSSYIPLHHIEDKQKAEEKEARETREDKRAGKERELDPSLDLKLLDVNGNVLYASDYFDRIYVDEVDIALTDAAAKNYVLQASVVRDLNGRLHQSVDQWFGF